MCCDVMGFVLIWYMIFHVSILKNPFAIGSPVRITSYVRFAVGEGLSVDTSKKLSFAEEVAQKRQGL